MTEDSNITLARGYRRGLAIRAAGRREADRIAVEAMQYVATLREENERLRYLLSLAAEALRASEVVMLKVYAESGEREEEGAVN